MLKMTLRMVCVTSILGKEPGKSVARVWGIDIENRPIPIAAKARTAEPMISPAVQRKVFTEAERMSYFLKPSAAAEEGVNMAATSSSLSSTP